MRALVLLTALLAGTAVQAQTVYRCGPEGRVYSQTPCPQGKAVDVSDERSAQQREASLERTRQEQERGDQLERDRLRREAGKPALPGKIDGRITPTEPAASAAKPKPGKKKKRKAQREDGDFKALAPKKPKP